MPPITHITTGSTSQPIDTTGANFLVAAVARLQVTGDGIPTDSYGNTWYEGESYHGDGGPAATITIWRCWNATCGPGHTFSIAPFGNSLAVAAFDIGEVDSDPLGQQNGFGLYNNGAATLQPGPVTTSNNGELIVTALAGPGSGTPTVDSGFSITDPLEVLFTGVSLAFLFQEAAAPVNPTWNFAGLNQGVAAAISTFTVSTGPPGQPSLTVIPSTGTATDAVNTLPITAMLRNSSATLSASLDGAGAISTTSPTSGTAFVYTPPATGAGSATVTVTDATDSLSATCVITYQQAQLSAPVLSGPFATAGSVSFDFTGINGGVAPYSTQLYRSAVSGLQAVGSPVAGVSGVLVDPCLYIAITTDANGDVATSRPPISIGFLGDSITAATYLNHGQGPAERCGVAISTALGRAVTITNRGANGQSSGGFAGGFPVQLADFAAAGVTDVLVTLGANDSKSPFDVAATTYQSNMQSIANYIVNAGMRCWLNYPIPAGWDAGTPTPFIVQYQASLAAIANGTTIRIGDTQAYSDFVANPPGGDGVHPDATGANRLGDWWAQPLISFFG